MKARLQTPLIALFCALLIAACDGGISGTGGSGPIIPDAMTDSDISLSGPTGGDDIEGDAVATEPLPSDTAFSNALDSSQRSDAIFKLINGVNGLGRIVANLNDGSSESLVPPPGLANSEGGERYLTLRADTHELDVFLASDLETDGPIEQLAGINPMSLAAGSSTTAILRGSTDESLNAPIEMFAIANQLGADNGNSIRIRIIHAAPAFGAAGPVNIFVKPEEASSPTIGLPEFEVVTYAEGDAGFVEVSGGSYIITAVDEADGETQRIPTLDPISPATGSSTTLVILDDPQGVAGVDVKILFINDGDRTGLDE